MDSIRDIRIEERRLEIERRRLEAAWRRDPDYGTLRGRYKEELYGRYASPFDANHWALLDDPRNALTIEKRTPRRLPFEVAYESVRAWAAQAFGPFADEWPFAQWSANGPAFGRMLWPLPVGRQALQSAITRCSRTSPAPFADMLPFDGDEHAFLILRIPVRTSHVTMFGLAQPDDAEDPVDDGTRTFRLRGCRFLLSSANPYDVRKDTDGARMRMVIGHARRFWGKFEGVKYRGGMGAGRNPQPDAIVELQRAKVAEAEAFKAKHPLVAWKHVAPRVGLGENQLRYLRSKIKREQETGEK